MESCKQATIPSGGVRGCMVRAIRRVQDDSRGALVQPELSSPKDGQVWALGTALEREETQVYIDLNAEFKTISCGNIPLVELDAKNVPTDKLARMVAKAKTNQIRRLVILCSHV